MGASYPDLNRCNFMYADDRRCRNPIETPGAAHCVYHRQKKEKESRPRPPRPATRPRTAASEALFQWFCYHPLDTATSIHQTLNQVVILLATGSLSPREADTYLRLCRLLLKNSSAVRVEFENPRFHSHSVGGENFLAEVRESLVPAILADDDFHKSQISDSQSLASVPSEPSLEEEFAAALANHPDGPMTLDEYFAKYAPGYLDPPAVNSESSLPNPPPAVAAAAAALKSQIPSPESVIDSARAVPQPPAPGTQNLPARPLTVDGQIAQIVCRNLTRETASPPTPPKTPQQPRARAAAVASKRDLHAP